MRVRIVSGFLKGRVIHGPEPGGAFRPTSERVRRSVADMLQPRIAGSTAADLCAGSGAFGFELLSRGATRVDFVENDRRRAAAIRENAEKLGVAANCRIFANDAAAFARSRRGPYDIVFFDPPYDDRRLAGMVRLFLRLVAENGMLVYECSGRSGAQGPEKGQTELKPFEKRIIGETRVELYRLSTMASEREGGDHAGCTVPRDV
jgi:16S rRNA (guanine966-N2)-methyltransferase